MTAPTPTTTAEFEDFLSAPERVAASLKDGTFGETVKAYAFAMNTARGGELAKMVQEQTQLALAEFLKNSGAADEGRIDLGQITNRAAQRAGKLRTPSEQKAATSARAPGTGLNGKFEDLASFIQATWHITGPNGRKSEIQNYMAEKVPAEGGFLVPEEFRSGLLEAALDGAIVRPRATVIPMETAKLSFPVLDSTSNVSSVFGGIVAYWTEEGAELTESAPKFARISLEPNKLTALADVTNELVRDWSGLTAFIEQAFPAAIRWYEDLAFIGGSGVGQPLGMLHSSNGALITINKETGQTAATITWENIVAMYSRMLPSSLSRAIWLASPDVFAQLATMALSVGTGGTAMWMTNGHDAPVLTLMGRPVIMTEKAPAALGTQGDLSFVDPTAYLIGDRMTMVMESSAHVRFTSDRTVWRFISRVDGRPWVLSAVTPQNNSASLSPFIQLQTRA